ncbi:MAG: hypothetical protein AAFZ38_00640 [Myxococcota bacterium]
MSTAQVLRDVSTQVQTIPETRQRAEAVIAAYEARSGVEVELSSEQMRTLELLAMGDDGAHYARAYLNLANYARVADISLGVRRVRDADGNERLEAIPGYDLHVDPAITDPAAVTDRLNSVRLYLDAVLHFLEDSEGQEAVAPRYRHLAPTELIYHYVEATISAGREHGGLTRAAIEAVRAEFIVPEHNHAFTSLFGDDAFVLNDAYGELERTGDASDPVRLEADTAVFVPSESDGETQVERPGYRPLVPGTALDRTPANYASAIRGAAGDARETVRLLTGLSGDELTEVAHQTLRGLGQPVPAELPALGSEARVQLIHRFRDAVIEPLSGRDRNIARAIVMNEGYTPPYVRLFMNATGFLSQNGASVNAQLAALTNEERAEAFRMIAAPPEEGGFGITRERLLADAGDSRETRLARFLSVVPKREDGSVDPGWLVGFQLMEASGPFRFADGARDFLWGGDLDVAQVLQIVSNASESEMARAAAAVEYLRRIDNRDFELPADAPAVLRPHPNPAGSTLARQLREEVTERVGGDERLVGHWVANLLGGMRFDPAAIPAGAADTESELEAMHARISERRAQVVGGAIALYEGVDPQAMVAALSQIDRDYRSDEVRPWNGRPSASRVREVATSVYGVAPEDVLPHARQGVGDRAMRDVANVALNENLGFFAPETVATLAYGAMHGGDTEMLGADRQRFYEAMNLDWLPYDERQDFLADVHSAYEARFGRSLLADVAASFGGEMTFEGPNGARTIESRAMALAQRGALNGAEKIVYGRYERTSLFNLVPRREYGTVVEGLNEAVGGAAFLTPAVLADMVGMPYDPSNPQAVYEAVLGALDSAAVQFARVTALPSVDDIGPARAELSLMLLRGTDVDGDGDIDERDAALQDDFATRVAAHPNEYIHRIFSGDREGRVEVQRIVNATIGNYANLEDFLTASAVGPDVLVAELEAAERRAGSGPLMDALNRAFGNEAEVVRDTFLELGAAAHQMEREIREHGVVSDATRNRVLELQRNLGRDIPNLEQLTASRRGVIVQGGQAALLIGAALLQPQLSPFALSLYNGLARVGLNAALGEYNPYNLATEGVRGAVAGASTQMLAGSIPEYDPIAGSAHPWGFDPVAATDYVVSVAYRAAATGGVNNFVSELMEPERHLYGTSRAVAGSVESTLPAAVRSGAVGGVFAVGTILVKHWTVGEGRQRVDVEGPEEPDPTPDPDPAPDPPDTDPTPDPPDPDPTPPRPPGSDGPPMVGDGSDGGVIGDGRDNVDVGDGTDGGATGDSSNGGVRVGTPNPDGGQTGEIPAGPTPPTVPRLPGVSGPQIVGEVGDAATETPLLPGGGGAPVVGGQQVPVNATPPPLSDPVLDRIGGNPTVGSVAAPDGIQTIAAQTRSAAAQASATAPAAASALPSSPVPFAFGETITLPDTGETLLGIDVPGVQEGVVLEVPVAGPPSQEYIDLFLSTAELGQLIGIQPVSALIFVWPEAGYEAANAVLAAATVSASEPLNRSHFNISEMAHRFLGRAQPRDALLNSVAMLHEAARRGLEGPRARADLSLEALERAAERAAGLPENYAQRRQEMDEDALKIELLTHIRDASRAVLMDPERSYQLPDGAYFGENGSVQVGDRSAQAPAETPRAELGHVRPVPRPERRAVEVPSAGSETSIDPDAEVRAQPMSAEERVDAFYDALASGELARIEQRAFSEADVASEAFQARFLPTLELLNGLEPGSLRARIESGHSLSGDELDGLLAIVNETGSLESALRQYEQNLGRIFGSYRGADGEVTATDFEFSSRLQELVGESGAAAVLLAPEVYEFLASAPASVRGTSPEDTAAQFNRWLASNRRWDPETESWSGSEVFLDPPASDPNVIGSQSRAAAATFRTDQRQAESSLRVGELLQPLRALLQVSGPADYAQVIQNLLSMHRAMLAEEHPIAPRVYRLGIGDVQAHLTAAEAGRVLRIVELMRSASPEDAAVISDILLGQQVEGRRGGGVFDRVEPAELYEVAESLVELQELMGEDALVDLPPEVVEELQERALVEDAGEPASSSSSGSDGFYEERVDAALTAALQHRRMLEQRLDNDGSRDERLRTALMERLRRGEARQNAETLSRVMESITDEQERIRTLRLVASRVRQLGNRDQNYGEVAQIFLELTGQGPVGVRLAEDLIQQTLMNHSRREGTNAEGAVIMIGEWDNVIRAMLPDPSANPDMLNMTAAQRASEEALLALGTDTLTRLRDQLEYQDHDWLPFTYEGVDRAGVGYLNRLLGGERPYSSR